MANPLKELRPQARHVYLTIERHGELYFDEIVTSTAYAESTVAGALEDLRAIDLVEQADDPDDARRHTYSVTKHVDFV